MAKVTDNLITQGMRGKIGNVVFCVRNGMTYASAAPQKSNKDPTKHQHAVRANFTRYVEYANSVMNNRELLPLYKAAAGYADEFSTNLWNYILKDQNFKNTQ